MRARGDITVTSRVAMVARSTTDPSLPCELGRTGARAGCSAPRGGRGWRSYDQMVNSSPAASSPAAAAGGTRSHGEQGRKEEGKRSLGTGCSPWSYRSGRGGRRRAGGGESRRGDLAGVGEEDLGAAAIPAVPGRPGGCDSRGRWRKTWRSSGWPWNRRGRLEAAGQGGGAGVLRGARAGEEEKRRKRKGGE